MIISFGFDKGSVPARAKKVFDVRGLDQSASGPEFDRKLEEILNWSKDHPREVIAIGCDQGKNRSVKLAQKASLILRTGVLHRDR